ncbi:MAG: hypothetical protein WC917_04550 [Bacilli bacterium]|jgi:hypothetical protein
MINSNIPSLFEPVYFKAFLVNYMERVSFSMVNAFTEEEHQGSSNYWKLNQQFIFAYLFGRLVKKRLYYGETLEEIEATFSIDDIRSKLTINHIDLDKVYESFNITY